MKKVGRPLMFKTPEELENKIEEYFIWIIEEESFVTITGIALFLGFESRQSFYDYAKLPQFTYAIKKARMRVENSYEICLMKGSPTGAIFALKNMGWTDKSEIEQTVSGTTSTKIEIVEDVGSN